MKLLSLNGPGAQHPTCAALGLGVLPATKLGAGARIRASSSRVGLLSASQGTHQHPEDGTDPGRMTACLISIKTRAPLFLGSGVLLCWLPLLGSSAQLLTHARPQCCSMRQDLSGLPEPSDSTAPNLSRMLWTRLGRWTKLEPHRDPQTLAAFHRTKQRIHTPILLHQAHWTFSTGSSRAFSKQTRCRLHVKGSRLNTSSGAPSVL